jgi:hypothetical protein
MASPTTARLWLDLNDRSHTRKHDPADRIKHFKEFIYALYR